MYSKYTAIETTKLTVYDDIGLKINEKITQKPLSFGSDDEFLLVHARHISPDREGGTLGPSRLTVTPYNRPRPRPYLALSMGGKKYLLIKY